jgi:hypothetical protein
MAMEDVVRMDAGFWALCDDPDVPMAIVDQLRAKKLSMHRLAAMGNSFWSAAVKHPAKLAAAVADLLAKDLSMDRLVAMGSSFWSAAIKHPAELAAAVADLVAKDLSMDRLVAMGNSFWSAAVKRPAELATSLTLLDKMKVADDALVKFQDAFWSRLQFHVEVLTLLTRDYGMRASDLHKLRSFWQTLNFQADVNALRAELATLHTRGDVTRCLRLKNNNAPIGDGARCCTHARPKVTASSATTPKATTQTSITNFFKP